MSDFEDMFESIFSTPKDKLDKAVLIANMRQVINQHSKVIQQLTKKVERLEKEVKEMDHD